jgi:hypothetical protein
LYPSHLAQCLFGNGLYRGTTIHVAGSALSHNTTNWLADNFYLSNNFESTLCFAPRIQNLLADMSLFVGLASWIPGAFLRIQSPLTWTTWDLGMKEHVITTGNVAGAKGWHDYWTSVDDKLLSSFTDYACWETAGKSFVDTVGLAHPLYNAKMCPCSRTKTGLADIHLDVGWNALEEKNYHFGAYARGVMPTGTRPHGSFLFEPIIGNGHHWELGGGLSGHACLWEHEKKGDKVGFYVDISATHLFATHQQRVFDLKNHGPLSRYILLINSSSSITPAANITRANVKVSVPVQVDMVAFFTYTNDTFSCDVGYNLWATTCATINCCDITTCNVCDACSDVSGLDGITWKPYTGATIHSLGSEVGTALSTRDLDLTAARTRSMSHKLFTNVAYSWLDYDDIVVPFIGLGAEVEFGSTSRASNCCSQCTISQWGLWLKTGTYF